MKESDLYPPIKAFLEAQSYEVKGEIHHCDIVAIAKQKEPLIVELKLTINLTVILQAVDRLALSPEVYISIPNTCKTFIKNRKRIIKLLRRLHIGLLTVDVSNQSVKCILVPSDYQPRQSKRRLAALLNEFNSRQGDPNKGGIAMTQGVTTAYRQQAITIADYLQTNGACRASDIAKALNQPKARNILYRNVYGWFERIGNGVYKLSSSEKPFHHE